MRWTIWPALDRGAGVVWPPLLILLITGALVVVLQPVLRGEVSSGLIFMLGIALIGATSGLVPALVSALAASLFFNFYMADPVLTFRMTTGDDLAPPIIFTLSAVISGVLSGRLRDRSSQLGRTNLLLESLLDTSRQLQAAPDLPAIQEVLGDTLPGKLGFHLWLYTAVEGETRSVQPGGEKPELIAHADSALAGEAVIRGSSGTAYRLEGSSVCEGALVIEGAGSAALDPAFLQALASLVGLAMERARFASVIAETEANLRAEGFKSVLLSSVSHDLRTPLTTISASASSLIDYGASLDDDTSRRLLSGIVDECDRLNRITANLLELSRLQSAGESISGQVLSVGDIVRSVVLRARQSSDDRRIRVSHIGQDAQVRADTALFELALTNVVHNAIQYSPPESEISIDVQTDAESCAIAVTDRGRGIPQCEQSRVFERFYRAGGHHPSPRGSGLGLAIAKGFVEVSGGSIDLKSPVHGSGGTSVTIRLPLVRESLT